MTTEISVRRSPMGRLIGLAGWMAALLLMIAVLRTVPLADALAVLARLGPPQLLLLAGMNLLIIFTFSGRWWIILLAQGHPIPYLRLSAYRLAAFGVTYFTPGPQFGGEPLQILLVQRRHGVPGSTALSALALDKTLELLANFSFLAAGTLLILRWDILPPTQGRLALIIALTLLALPLFLLVSAGVGRRPLTGLLNGLGRLIPRLPRRRQDGSGRLETLFRRVSTVVDQSEAQTSGFFQDRPGALFLAALITGFTWAGMVGEYWLLLSMLGLEISPIQAIGALTAARLAYLLPLPGGLGALEASQVLAMTLLGFDPAVGISISLFIRLRDVIMASTGLLLGWRLRG